MNTTQKLDRLERLLSLKGQLAKLRIHRASLAPATRTIADRFSPGKTLKASSAEAILRVCLRRKGWAKQYRKGELTGPEHLELLGEVRKYGCAWLHHEAQAFVAKYGKETTERSLTGAIGAHARRLFSRMKTFVKELYVAGAMALLGPRALTEKELSAIDHQHAVQVQYFDRFERQAGETPVIKAPDGTPVIVGPKPEQPLDGTFPARAEKYGASVWGSIQEVARATAADTFTIERRVHVPVRNDTPCHGCRSEVAKGWSPVGTLLEIGDCQCYVFCHCHFEYRVDEASSRIYSAGEVPDNEGDFGSEVIDV